MNALVALVSDILSACGIPGGSSLQEATRVLLQRRLVRARDILREELRHGRIELAEAGAEDEFAAILFRYQRAAIEGAARLNLHLLAAVAAGQAARGGFAADEFLAWADMLALLRREEVILIATLHRIERHLHATDPDAADLLHRVRREVERALIPDPFGVADEVWAAAGACVRTGLVRVIGGMLDD